MSERDWSQRPVPVEPGLARIVEWMDDAERGIYRLQAEIEALRNGDVGFREFETMARGFLTKYPESVFDGSSGDPGPVFVVALREAVTALPAPPIAGND